MALNKSAMAPYIELGWYNEQVNTDFPCTECALDHYVNEGERKNVFPNRIFNPAFYRDQNSLSQTESCLGHFIGTRNPNSKPNPYFDLEWYEWQNPDYVDHLNGLLHYLAVGGSQFRDPSPGVDMFLLSHTHAELGDGADIVNALATGKLTAAELDAVTLNGADLVARQRKFLSSLYPKLLTSKSSTTHGTNLLFVQCCEDSNFWKWFDATGLRDWDLFLNCYAGHFPATKVAEHVCVQSGTKFTGILNCWRYYGEIFDRYEHVFFIDDDLIFDFSDVSRFFEIVIQKNLDLAQPSLSVNSHCSWKVFANASESGIRRVNSVEIMMPSLSRRARSFIMPYFMLSASGFGLDFLMAKLARRCDFVAAVVDSVIVRHEKQIDQAHGSYYQYLRKNKINSKYELWRLVKSFDLEMSLYEV